MKNFPFFRRQRDANDEAESAATIEGERTATAVNSGMRIQAKITNIVIIGGIMSVVVFALGKYYIALAQQHEADAAQPKDSKHTMATNLPPLTMPSFPTAAAAPIASPASAPPPLAPAMGNDGRVEKPAPTAAELRLARQLGSPVLFKVGNTGGNLLGKAGEGGEDSATSTTGSGQPGGYKTAKAFMLPDPSMMVTLGTVIPCVVLPMINTTLPGMVTCIQSKDVRSADKSVVLLERNTKWYGMQSTGLAQGMKRVGIIWLRAETPNHVLVPVDIASGDALGQPGIEGEVDTHFWRRIGEAVAVSLISDVGSYFAATKQGSGNNNTTIAFPATVTGTQNAMSDILKKTLDIPDTLRRDQGAEINIFVQKEDFDFRDVYKLRRVAQPLDGVAK